MQKFVISTYGDFGSHVIKVASKGWSIGHWQ